MPFNSRGSVRAQHKPDGKLTHNRTQVGRNMSMLAARILPTYLFRNIQPQRWLVMTRMTYTPKRS